MGTSFPGLLAFLISGRQEALGTRFDNMVHNKTYRWRLEQVSTSYDRKVLFLTEKSANEGVLRNRYSKWVLALENPVVLEEV